MADVLLDFYRQGAMGASLIRQSHRRRFVALACGVGALAAAVAAAVGPAVPDRATYSWPPPEIPDQHPTRTWFAPLLLNTRSADILTTSFDCNPGKPLTRPSEPVLVLATARHAQREHALQITYTSGTTTIRVGSSTLAHLRNNLVPCRIALRIEGTAWTISQTGSALRHGYLDAPVGVNGLITQLDLHNTVGPRTVITPATQDTHPSHRQTLLRLLTAFLVATAFWLVINPRKPSRPKRPHVTLTLPDSAVVITLLTWWIIGPIYFDDGWIRARQLNALASGGFSTYYEAHGADLPLGTWLEWLQQFVLAHTTALVVHRIPSLICLAIAWVVARHVLTWVIGSPTRRGDAAWWSAALVFCIGAAGFGITLRPEPAHALLVVGTLACAVRFARKPALLPLAVGVLLVGLAVSEHPLGLVSASSLLICLPRIVREARARVAFGPIELAVIVTGGLAWTILLAFLDSDLARRQSDAAELRTYAAWHGGGPLDEWQRYWGQIPGPPVRHEFVLVLLLIALSIALDRRVRRSLEAALPAASVAVGLVMLAFVPSKFVWHFGVFAGLAAVAAGVEIRRLGERSAASKGWALAGATTVVVGTAFSSLVSFGWGPLDLRASRWSDAPFELAIGVLAVTVLVAEAIVHRSRGQVTWRPVLWLLPVAIASLLGITSIAFVADAIRTNGWTATREALTHLTGGSTCGLADRILVPDPSSMSALTPVNDSPRSGAARVRRGAPAPAAATILPANTTSPWYKLVPSLTGFFLEGAWGSEGSIQVDWGSYEGATFTTLASGTVDLQEGLIRDREPSKWRFVAAASLPPRPVLANAVRLELGSPGAQSAGAAVTSPISYGPTSLRSLIEVPGRLTLASPYVYSALPCVRLPLVTLGAAEPPALLIDWVHPPAITFLGSPFGGVSDLYDVRRLPLADSSADGKAVVVRTVDVDPRDAVLPAHRSSSGGVH